jgi:CRISPR-associated exonuclease Cas4
VNEILTKTQDKIDVTDLKQWICCPRIVYYRYCLPAVRPITYSMQAGVDEQANEQEREERRSLHRYGIESGERFFDLHLYSAKRRLHGRVDLVIRTPDEAVVVDYKLSDSKAGPHFKLQLAAYGLMLSETWKIPVKRGFIYHIGQHKAEAIPLTIALYRKVEQTVNTIWSMIDGERFLAATPQTGRCVTCEFRRFCNDTV